MIGVVDQLTQEYLNLVRIKDDFVAAQCPFHKDGQERRPSFWVSRTTGSWGCFSCPSNGSNLKSLLQEIGVSNSRIEAEIEEAMKDASKTLKLHKAKRQKKARSELKGTFTLPEALLGVFDYEPLSLIEAGFDPDVLTKHDIGFDRRINRITFPIRDYAGSLVGISGRAVEDNISPKYLFYNGRKVRDGEVVEGELGEWYPSYSNEDVKNHLWRSQLVYPELIDETDGQIIIVEGFKAALWMVQQNWLMTVATMGTHVTEAQVRILRRLGATIFVLMDNNGPGREASKYLCQRLAVSSFPVYECHYPDYCDGSCQPDDLNPEEIKQVLSNAKRAGGRYGLVTSTKKRFSKQSKVLPRKKR